MRFPWVLRSTLDREMDQRRMYRDANEELKKQHARMEEAFARENTVAARFMERMAADHEKQMVASETRYADLMASYRLLILNGAKPKPAEPTSTPIEKPDPVQAAINARAPAAKTRKLMEAQVRLDRSMDLTDPEIIARIERGNRPAEDFA